MIISASELREKDVINTCDGKKLGYICDFVIDTDCGKICDVYVTDQFFGVFQNKNTIKIPFEKINCIGEDTILVNLGQIPHCTDNQQCGCDHKKDRKKHGWLF